MLLCKKDFPQYYRILPLPRYISSGAYPSTTLTAAVFYRIEKELYEIPRYFAELTRFE